MYIAKRTRRTWIDLLKLCWVLSSGVSFLWFMLRLPYIGVVELVPTMIFWPMYLSVVIAEALGKDQSVEEDLESEGLPQDIL
jgi:Na+/H+ antiporter NhaD/arsenite permease-like protein